MEKTTIYLTGEQKAALTAAAREQGRSEARLIRDGIDRVLGRHGAAEQRATLAADVANEEAPSRPQWIGRDAFLRAFGPAQADAALRDELRSLAPDLTEDLSPR